MSLELEALSLPVAAFVTIVSISLVLIAPWVVWHRAKSWRALHEGVDRLKSYSVEVTALSDNGRVSAQSVIGHKYLNGSVVLVSHVHPSAINTMKQMQRDAVSQFLTYILLGVIVFVAVSAQATGTGVSLKTAFAGIFMGADFLLLIRLFERYRTLSDQIEFHGETVSAVTRTTGPT